MMNRKYEFERPDTFTLSSSNADICIEGLSTSIIVKNDKLYKNSEAYSPSVPQTVIEGERIALDDVYITLLPESIIIETTDKDVISSLKRKDSLGTPFEGFPNYKRSPRIIKKCEEFSLRLSPPKPLPQKKKGELFQMILPPLLMLTVTILVSILMKRGMFVFISAASMGVTVLISIIRYINSRKDGKDDKKIRVEKYQEYLLNKRKEIFAAYTTEKEAYEYNYPNITELSRMVNSYSSRIYERSPHDDDFLKISLGTALVPSMVNVSFEKDELKTEDDALEDEALELKKEFSLIEKPVVVDLKNAHLGLTGDSSIIHKQLKILLAELTFFRSYHDLEIVFLYNEQYSSDFDWLRWYPHFKIHALNCTGLINTERKRDQILGSLNQILKERKIKEDESKKDSMFLPHFLFIIDEPKWIMDHSIMEYIGRDGSNIGFSIIYTSQQRANLPENIGTIAEFLNSHDARLVLEEKDERKILFKLQNADVVDFEWMARNLGVLNHQQGVSARIPESITFLKMYGVQKPSELNIAQRWSRNDSSKSLAVPLGARAEDDYVYLNLHEKAHGPHGLVAGTTGSGKSEIIQSYILSLAVNFSPYEVAFLLIDYKGGGMASLFRNLPHLLGTITNLDGSQSQRAMSSIKAELARRQNIFNDNNVNHINNYNTLVKTGVAKEPLPHLFIISDEFAELKKEQPDFMKELVSTARIGRSLGVHLILATQKPTGVVDDQIWSNSRFKLALKVQDESDSKEILKTADAANITQTGRAYLQVGNNEIYELFQSAWSGASYDDEKGMDKKDERVYIINELGQGELVNQDLSGSSGEVKLLRTQLDAVVDYIADYYSSLNMMQVTKPWLPPLTEKMINPVKAVKSTDSISLDLNLGVVDIPEQQLQAQYTVNTAKDGNILYVAASGFGKTVFLTTCALTLAATNSVNNLNLYILDLGNSGLISLKKLHHTADYIVFDDDERISKFVRIISDEISSRKRKFAEAAVQNFEVYNQVSDQKMKAIVILIDNMDVVKEMNYDMDEFMQKVLRDGQGLGIFVISSVNRSNAIRYSIINYFRCRVCGYTVDETDAQSLLGRTKYKLNEIKGRTLVKYDDSVCYMQNYVMCDFENEIEYNKGIDNWINDINSLYPEDIAPKIPVLPETLTYLGFQDYNSNNRYKDKIYLGLDKFSVIPCAFDRMDTPFLIIGESKRGKTNAVKIIVDQIVGKGTLYLFDSQAMELYSYKDNSEINYYSNDDVAASLVDLESLVSKRREEYKEAIKDLSHRKPKDIIKGFEPVYIVIDDIDDLISVLDMNANNKMAQILTDATSVGVSIILTANTGKFRGFDAVSKFAKNTTYGLMVGTQGPNSIFPITSNRDMPEFKDGLLWSNGTYHRIRIPGMPESV